MNTSPPTALPQNIPELDRACQIHEVPERITVALDARQLEKTMLAELVERWLHVLQPEVEKMARDLVQRSAEEYWQQRSATPEHK
jgi:phosphoribosylformimino-5-aminoimidazole carboxamide ribonucleotide (ProFAR) isomerase